MNSEKVSRKIIYALKISGRWYFFFFFPYVEVVELPCWALKMFSLLLHSWPLHCWILILGNEPVCHSMFILSTKKYHVFAPMGRFQLESMFILPISFGIGNPTITIMALILFRSSNCYISVTCHNYVKCISIFLTSKFIWLLRQHSLLILNVHDLPDWCLLMAAECRKVRVKNKRPEVFSQHCGFHHSVGWKLLVSMFSLRTVYTPQMSTSTADENHSVGWKLLVCMFSL